MFSEQTPGAIWSSRPSLRAMWASVIATLVITVVVWNMIPFGIKALYEATPNLPFWSYNSLMLLQWVVKGAMLLGLVVNVIRLFVLWTERYEVTNDRFLHHHGILVRKHDQIELQRFRDFQATSPLMSQALGLGKVLLLSRDETSPRLLIGPFVNALEVRDTIRTAMLDHQKATGYREFESHG